VTDSEITLYLEGTVRNEARPTLYISLFSHQKMDAPKGLELQLIGYLTNSWQTEKFESVVRLSVAYLWGAITYNACFDDLVPAPTDVAFELVTDTTVVRTPLQAILSAYFETVWKLMVLIIESRKPVSISLSTLK